jgi:hypothetical protein
LTDKTICYVRKLVESDDDKFSILIGRACLGIDYMNLLQLKHAMRRLSLSQLRKLDEWLHELIRKAEQAAHAEQLSSDRQTLDNRTYRQESIRCGKENCKCARGKLHGPYWYSYVRVNDKVTSNYIGKSLPKGIEKKLKASKQK